MERNRYENRSSLEKLEIGKMFSLKTGKEKALWEILD